MNIKSYPVVLGQNFDVLKLNDCVEEEMFKREIKVFNINMLLIKPRQ